MLSYSAPFERCALPLALVLPLGMPVQLEAIRSVLWRCIGANRMVLLLVLVE